MRACQRFFTIAINETYRLAPWADVLYAADYQWWDRHQGVPEFDGLRYALRPFGHRYPHVTVLERGEATGLSEDPRALALGRNSGYQAINLAVHFGATVIVLLGYDMQPAGDRHHWHDPHPGDRHPGYAQCVEAFATLKEPLTRRGIQVLNGSSISAIPSTTFPRVSLHEVLRVYAPDIDHRSEFHARGDARRSRVLRHHPDRPC